ncbi:MAG: alpha-L-fucosidase [Verrucomicrobiota bacterium]
MINPILAILAALLLAPLTLTAQAGPPEGRAPAREALMPTAAERDARLGWWREARFGMFVHWGVYSSLSGTWNGRAYGGYGEHIQRMAKIPIPVYRKEVAGKFNPVDFNADEWIRQAKEAGMGYFIITAKHHDGFAMYDSSVSDYNIVQATPFARDPMKELRAACKKYGLKFGFYYSHAFDWGEANGPGNDWDYENPGGDRLLHGKNWWEKYPEFLPKARKYVDGKSIPQILELIRNYDPDILWFDTPHKLPDEENRRILAAVRQAKPGLVVNGRLVSGLGDYDSTCDRPAEFPPHDGDWEGIPTTNESYGYNRNDRSHKPASHFIRLIAKSAARGGNELMNIGPMGDGRIDGADVKILTGISQWWKVNGESIRGTTRTPLAVQAWGESTRKGNTLYLHVFDWPNDGRLVVGGLQGEVQRAYLLARPGQLLKVSRAGMDVAVEIPPAAPDPADSIIVLECAGEPRGDAVRLIAANVGTNILRAFDAKLVGKLRFGSGKQSDDTAQNWTTTKDAVIWPVRLNQKAAFEMTLQYDGSATSKSKRLMEGDAGREIAPARDGAGGKYVIQVAGKEFFGTVRQGGRVVENFGEVTLPAGNFEIRVVACEISGQELFSLRNLMLTPLMRGR